MLPKMREHLLYGTKDLAKKLNPNSTAKHAMIEITGFQNKIGTSRWVGKKGKKQLKSKQPLSF